MSEEFTPNCRCKKGVVRSYLRHENAEEGTLVIDHEPTMRPEDNPEGNSWKGGLCIERRWKDGSGKEYNDFVLLDFSEVERVRGALDAFIFDHTP